MVYILLIYIRISLIIIYYSHSKIIGIFIVLQKCPHNKGLLTSHLPIISTNSSFFVFLAIFIPRIGRNVCTDKHLMRQHASSCPVLHTFPKKLQLYQPFPVPPASCKFYHLSTEALLISAVSM